MSKYTAGLWHCWNKGGDGESPYTWEVAGPMHSRHHVVIADKLTEGNARLIAEAPLLLESCKFLLELLSSRPRDFENNVIYKRAFEAAHRTVERAEGKTE